MRHCPWQLAVRHPERFLLLPLLRSPPHRHARSVRTMAVNHSTFIANANPDFHHGLLGEVKKRRDRSPHTSAIFLLTETGSLSRTRLLRPSPRSYRSQLPTCRGAPF